MSGEAVGLLLLPLSPVGLLLLGGVAVASLAAAGAQAAAESRRYEQQQRSQRPYVGGTDYNGQAKLSNDIGDFRSRMSRTMEEQQKANIKASEDMLRQIENTRAQITQAAQKHDIEAFLRFSEDLKQSRGQTMEVINGYQKVFEQNYKKRISADMDAISGDINRRCADSLARLNQYKTDAAEYQRRAALLSQNYMDRAKALLLSLERDFEGGRFAPRELALLKAELDTVTAQHEAGRYEAAAAGAKDTSIRVLEEIYNADLKKQEWENYYKLCLVLSEELRTYLEANEYVTPQAVADMEKKTGAKYDADIAGVRIADYSGKNNEGKTRADYLKEKTLEIYDTLRAKNGRGLPVKDLAEYARFLNSELYPAAVLCNTKAIANINNAYSRQNISEEIIDVFEDHNFTFSGYAYDQDRHDKTLLIGLTNDTTGEELIVSLAPEFINGGVQTKVELKQIKGDETNEQKKAEYRAYIEDVVNKNNPGAQISLSCKEETRNKLSPDTQSAEKLRAANRPF